MNWETFGAVCAPQNEETRRRFQALQSLLQLYDPSVRITGDLDPNTIAATNRLGFSFATCDDLASNIDEVVTMLGAVVVDPVTGTPKVPAVVMAKSSLNKAGLPWWVLLLVAGGAIAYNYTQPKKDRWF